MSANNTKPYAAQALLVIVSGPMKFLTAIAVLIVAFPTLAQEEEGAAPLPEATEPEFFAPAPPGVASRLAVTHGDCLEGFDISVHPTSRKRYFCRSWGAGGADGCNTPFRARRGSHRIEQDLAVYVCEARRDVPPPRPGVCRLPFPYQQVPAHLVREGTAYRCVSAPLACGEGFSYVEGSARFDSRFEQFEYLCGR
jgi:hypothetical protein